MIVFATTAIVAPTAAYASHVFTDVNHGSFYASSVTWAKDNGITNGCNPSEGNTKYCPNDPVTRGTMAVFLKNLAGSRAVDAGTLDGLDSADFRVLVERVAKQSSTLIPDSCKNYTRVTIDVPVAGSILVEADVTLSQNHSEGTHSGVSLHLDRSPTSCTFEVIDGQMSAAFASVPSAYPTAQSYEQMRASRLFDVSAGAHTFYLNGDAVYSATATSFYDAVLQATFYPG